MQFEDEEMDDEDDGDDDDEEGEEDVALHEDLAMLEEEAMPKSELLELDSPSDDMNLQLKSTTGDYFKASDDGHSGLGEAVYERVVPPRFADGGDNFMESMIRNYALEGKNEDGTPNGKFVMDESTTRQAASEILKTHKKLEGKENDEYLKTYF